MKNGNRVDRFINEVNGEYFIYQTITNSNPVEYYVADSLSQDWISFWRFYS